MLLSLVVVVVVLAAVVVAVLVDILQIQVTVCPREQA
jgi:hypothetical protein